MKKTFIMLLLTAFGLVGCSTSKVYPELPEETVKYSSGKDYTIGIGDQLTVNVWRNSDLSVSVVVRPDGKISLPLVGDVAAAGVTAVALAETLTVDLQNYVRTPQVTVIVNNAVSSEFIHRVRVTGAVAQPTSVPYRKGMTVMDLVLLSGGTTPFAANNDAKLYREVGEGKQSFPIYLDDVLKKGDLRTNYALKPGDIIAIPERSF